MSQETKLHAKNRAQWQQKQQALKNDLKLPYSTHTDLTAYVLKTKNVTLIKFKEILSWKKLINIFNL